jgi:hypothetical protein
MNVPINPAATKYKTARLANNTMGIVKREMARETNMQVTNVTRTAERVFEPLKPTRMKMEESPQENAVAIANMTAILGSCAGKM